MYIRYIRIARKTPYNFIPLLPNLIPNCLLLSCLFGIRNMKGGRIRDLHGINPFKYYEVYPDKIDFDDFLKNRENIYVLAHQPGIGKTHSVMDYIVNKIREDDDFTFFYFTDRHKAIEEHIASLEKKKDKELLEDACAHWMGFGKYCHKKAKSLYESYQIPIDLLTEGFGLDNSLERYKEQFKHYERVFAPYNYLAHGAFCSHLPQIIFLDERISQIKKYSRERISQAFKDLQMDNKFVEAIQCGDHEFFDEKRMNKIKKAHYCFMDSALKNEDYEMLGKMKGFYPSDVKIFLKYDLLYDEQDLDVYGYPFYYYAFDVVTNDVPIVIMDATFNERLFHYFLESYNGEMRELGENNFDVFQDLNVKIYLSNWRNPDTIIYRMRPTGSLARRSIVKNWDKTREWLSHDMQRIMDIFGRGNVGIITFKEYGKILQAFGFDVEYFGALRGTNLLEDKKVLVILGGWFPPIPSWKVKRREEGKEYLNDLIRKYFLKEIEKDNVKEAYVSAPEEIVAFHKYTLARRHITTEGKWGKGKTPADEADNNPISMINKLFNDEMYQAFHRNRGLRYDRIIFAYCWFPEPDAIYQMKDGERRVERFVNYNLREEFGMVRKVRNEDATEFFNELEKQYSTGKVESIQREFEKGNIRGVTPSNTKIAIRYHIWEGSGKGPDTNIIKAFRGIYTEMKEKAKKK